MLDYTVYRLISHHSSVIILFILSHSFSMIYSQLPVNKHVFKEEEGPKEQSQDVRCRDEQWQHQRLQDKIKDCLMVIHDH